MARFTHFSAQELEDEMNRDHSILRLRTIILLILLLFVAIPPTLGQVCRLSMTVSQTPVHELSIADVDFQHFQTRSLLFTVNIANNQNGEQEPATLQLTQLRVRLSIFLADGTNLSDALNFITERFQVPPMGKSFTNLNLGHDIKAASAVQLSQEAIDRVQDVALAAGQFPAGRYVFSFALEPVACTGDSKDIAFDLTNSSRVDLRSPRDGEFTNEFPFFDFYQDGTQATLTIAEKLPDQSREDALSRKPPMQEVELINGQHSFLYSAGRPLEPGKTYAWQVVTKSAGAGGTKNNVESPIWLFTVSSSGGATAPDAILLQLEEILGPRYKPVFDQIRNGGYTLTGETLNGSTLSPLELLTLINALRDISDSIELSFQ